MYVSPYISISTRKPLPSALLRSGCSHFAALYRWGFPMTGTGVGAKVKAEIKAVAI